MESRAQGQSCYFHRPPAKHQVHPWLLIRHGSGWHRQIFYDISEDHYYTRIIRDLFNKQIFPTSREWLVLRDYYSAECYVWNPNSMEKVQLPCAAQIDFDCCFLTSSPADTSCHILLIHLAKSIIWFCRLGEDAFREHKIEHGDRDGFDDMDALTSVSMYNGELYLLTCMCNLIKVDLVGSELEYINLTRKDFCYLLPQPRSMSCRHYLVESGGELLMVRSLQSGDFDYAKFFGFHVFRMNFNSKMWEKIDSIGEWTIFLSDGNQVSCSPEDCRVRRNCIYYAMRYDPRLYLYDLEDQSISALLPCPIASRRRSILRWIMM